MKKINITILLIMLMSMVSNKLYAYDIAVENDDGVTIYYNWINEKKELEVTYREKSEPYEHFGYENVIKLSIPEIVIINDQSYCVTSIGEYAFHGCSSLTSINIPKGVTSIEGATFSGCSSLVSINIPESVTSIGFEAFYGCSGLTSINIPDGVRSIGYGTFSGCSCLTSINIPKGVTSIEGATFSGCSSLVSINIPESVTSLGYRAFYGCSGLTSITIPKSVKSIGWDAFYQCTGTNSVFISDLAQWCSISFETQMSNPLSYAKLLYLNGEKVNNLIIPDNVTSIKQYAFSNCTCFTSLTIPSNMTIIDENTFANCQNMSSLSLPEGLKIIRKGAFSGCRALKELAIPSTVEYIYSEAFANCGLVEVKSMAVKPPFAYDNTFSNYSIPLYVPAESFSDYKETSPWNKFTELKVLSGETPTILKCATPTISYKKGKLTFNSETEYAVCESTITDSDITSYVGNEVQLGVTYHISVYATKAGYENSDVATATLCWIDVEPRTEGITNDIAQIQAHAVLIQSENGEISVAGLDDGTKISVYEINGMQAGTAVSNNGQAVISTHLPSGSIAIVKIGEKSVKVTIK